MMEFDQVVYNSHRELSNCSAAFLDYIAGNPEGLERSNFNNIVLAEEFLHNRMQPWPVFINQKTRNRMESANSKVFDLITSIPERIFDYDLQKIADYFELPFELVNALWIGVNNRYLKRLLGRGDYIFTPSGGIKCIEFNLQANLGGWGLDLQEPMYQNNPVIAKFLTENQTTIKPSQFFRSLLSHLIHCGLTQLSGSVIRAKELNTVIVFSELGNKDFRDMLASMYQEILKSREPEFKGELLICNVYELRPDKNRLMHRDKMVHIMLEMNNGNIPVKLMTGVLEYKLLVFNGPVTQLMSNKFNLALLSEHENSTVFSEEEREIIKQYIPWTRKILRGETEYNGQRISLPGFIISNKDKLAIKPSDGIGGVDVHLGFNVSDSEWQALIEKAIQAKNWVVQEYVESQPYMFQHSDNGYMEHNVIWGLFAFGANNYGGGFLRILPTNSHTGVINLKQGSAESIIIEVDEQT